MTLILTPVNQHWTEKRDQDIACNMTIITENIRAHVFQDGNYLKKKKFQMPNGEGLDEEILQINEVTWGP